MIQKIENLKLQIEEFLILSADELRTFKQTFLARGGYISTLFSELNTALPEDRKEIGVQLNLLKDYAQEKFLKSKDLFFNDKKTKTFCKNNVDFTIPPSVSIGGMHPISIVIERSIEILKNIGFALVEGPEIEDEWHNFTALNIPDDHPARDMQDTFYVKDRMLRSQTSTAQIHVMENQKPPIRIMTCGRCYRNETITSRSHCFFNQLEILYINENVSFVDLKTTLLHFVKNLFGSETKLRFRPSYFPFTEPSAEADISCTLCKGAGCKICKYSGWLEMGGCGMVDPQVLINCKIDPENYSGFAWGFGIERITMLIYQIDDIRLFTENDIRFLEQFKGVRQ